MSKTIDEVVDNLLCTQCGTCVSVCPVQAIEMHETPAGMLVGIAHDKKCIACGLCRRFCPGATLNLNLDDFGDPFRGNISGAYVGHCIDGTLRSTGQSGGVVSGLLLYLLETGRINAALVSTMPQDGSLRPKSVLARTKEEICSAQGSKYCPVPLNSTLRHIQPGEIIATVGVPCQIHGIHNLERGNSALVAGIQYKIGLFCDRTLHYTCIDKMASKARLKLADIAGIEYRSKAKSGWPGDVSFKLHSGDIRYFPSTHRTRLKEYFTPPCCRLCFDKTNILSDLSIGDAWGVSETSKGDSVIIARNEKGVSLLMDACDKGYLEVEPFDVDSILKAQFIDNRKKYFASFTTVWHEMGRTYLERKSLNSHFYPTIGPSFKKKCKKLLLFNCRVAQSTSRWRALMKVNLRQISDKFKSRLMCLYGKLF